MLSAQVRRRGNQTDELQQVHGNRISKCLFWCKKYRHSCVAPFFPITHIVHELSGAGWSENKQMKMKAEHAFLHLPTDAGVRAGRRKPHGSSGAALGRPRPEGAPMLSRLLQPPLQHTLQVERLSVRLSQLDARTALLCLPRKTWQTPHLHFTSFLSIWRCCCRSVLTEHVLRAGQWTGHDVSIILPSREPHMLGNSVFAFLLSTHSYCTVNFSTVSPDVQVSLSLSFMWRTGRDLEKYQTGAGTVA